VLGLDYIFRAILPYILRRGFADRVLCGMNKSLPVPVSTPFPFPPITPIRALALRTQTVLL
jgi:hypothetical protein